MAEQLYLSSLIRVLTSLKEQLGDLPISVDQEMLRVDDLEIKTPITAVDGPAPDGLGTYLEGINVSPYLNIRSYHN